MAEKTNRSTLTIPLLSVGFRPFFLLASGYTAFSMVLWLPYFQGELELYTTFTVVDWHIHEWLFGFLPAIITGFLLTAVPNWTGRLPIRGISLAFLVSIWIFGRIAISFSDLIGWLFTALIDCSFLILVALLIAREVITGKNWKNLKVLLPLSILALANIFFHIESAFHGSTDISRRFGIAASIALILLIGGRIIPSFTRNWLVRENPGKLPKPFGKFDMYSIVMSVIALLCWIVFPNVLATGILLILAGVVQFIRLCRWAGHRTWHEPLVVILHLSYLFIPIGFLLLSLGIFFPETVPLAAGIHILGVGAIGGMTLSVMMRASLGHTGQDLKASPFSVLIFAGLVVSVCARLFQALSIGDYELMFTISGVAWIFAFGGFALSYGPALLRPKG
ncbi:NnrS family protein [Lentilitoribacter sp. EG35]|uniref:NnrS family protein n=1 Tax=Lentilitoribacter sp. EG35 TaxID=3234192 RepID=UPI0034609DF1